MISDNLLKLDYGRAPQPRHFGRPVRLKLQNKDMFQHHRFNKSSFVVVMTYLLPRFLSPVIAS
jgi:hypothetical protein